MTIYVIEQRTLFYDGDTSEWNALYAERTREAAETDIKRLTENGRNKSKYLETEYVIKELNLYN